MTDIYEIIGQIAAILTTSSFAPQVYKTWREKSSKGISLAMYVMIFVGVAFWLVYGLHIKSTPIITANIATEIMVIMMLYFKFKYRE
ncbi:MAG: hypothetical protein COB81_01720 [Flavobacteriaceae bacterium]|nr:MAG: hypothetical protein COB81_01720 [Flavobacteriaceae bacterium]